jgi:hypothetical protein
MISDFVTQGVTEPPPPFTMLRSSASIEWGPE